MDTKGERRGGMKWEIRMDTYTLPRIKKITHGSLLYTAQGTLLSALR